MSQIPSRDLVQRNGADLTHFRKRFDQAALAAINQSIVATAVTSAPEGP